MEENHMFCLQNHVLIRHFKMIQIRYLIPLVSYYLPQLTFQFAALKQSSLEECQQYLDLFQQLLEEQPQPHQIFLVQCKKQIVHSKARVWHHVCQLILNKCNKHLGFYHHLKKIPKKKCRSVNRRDAHFAHHVNMCSPKFSDLATALLYMTACIGTFYFMQIDSFNSV